MVRKRKTVVIIQARMNSTRLPGKVLKELDNKPMLEFMVNRVKKSKEIDDIYIATTISKEDDAIEEIGKTKDIKVARGDKNDVLSRYSKISKKSEAEIIIRLTGDCPLIDPDMIDTLTREFKNSGVDYMCNCNPPTYPDGLDIEIFSREVLDEANKRAKSPEEREHVTLWMQSNKELKKGNYTSKEDLSNIRWTVDENLDLITIRRLVANVENAQDASWLKYLEEYKKNENKYKKNESISRNEGSIKNSGQKLWRRAICKIPGGNMLLSKRPELYLPEQWPAYYSKAKGCTVWDLDGRPLTDMSIMGIGTNILGYCNENVDNAVKEVVDMGNMSSLNCPEEVELAEKLVMMHRWSDMARFARSGGEANAIAIRIARAATGKDKIAVCGYHGWHDWYLASNLGNNSRLEEHLLPGLEPIGVPKNLRNTVFPFSYNNFEELENIVNNNELAAVKMEVERSMKPRDKFLERVRELCTRNGVVLIFDECTSGFREAFGGLHLKYKVDPDMAMFGKALGNGYAITAIIGKKEIMEATQNTFISSTFWTERIGPTAALKTLEIMEKTESWKTITKQGEKIRNGWQKIADEKGIKIKIEGLNALSGYGIISKKAKEYKTLISQEMLKRGYLATTCCYTAVAHTDKIVEEYLENLNEVFEIIQKCENGKNIDELLNGPICHDGFKRLN